MTPCLFVRHTAYLWQKSGQPWAKIGMLGSIRATCYSDTGPVNRPSGLSLREIYHG